MIDVVPPPPNHPLDADVGPIVTLIGTAAVLLLPIVRARRWTDDPSKEAAKAW